MKLLLLLWFLLTFDPCYSRDSPHHRVFPSLQSQGHGRDHRMQICTYSVPILLRPLFPYSVFACSKIPPSHRAKWSETAKLWSQMASTSKQRSSVWITHRLQDTLGFVTTTFQVHQQIYGLQTERNPFKAEEESQQSTVTATWFSSMERRTRCGLVTCQHAWTTPKPFLTMMETLFFQAETVVKCCGKALRIQLTHMCQVWRCQLVRETGSYPDFTSWKSATDPSQGNYTMAVDSGASPP